VLGFFSSRPNWDPLTLSPAGECVPLPFGSGWGIQSLAGEGVGGSSSDEGRHCGTQGICDVGYRGFFFLSKNSTIWRNRQVGLEISTIAGHLRG
jgi:hypothetical protein